MRRQILHWKPQRGKPNKRDCSFINSQRISSEIYSSRRAFNSIQEGNRHPPHLHSLSPPKRPVSKSYNFVLALYNVCPAQLYGSSHRDLYNVVVVVALDLDSQETLSPPRSSSLFLQISLSSSFNISLSSLLQESLFHKISVSHTMCISLSIDFSFIKLQ